MNLAHSFNWALILCYTLLCSCSDTGKNNRPDIGVTVNGQEADKEAGKDQLLASADPALVDDGSYLSYAADAKDIKMYWKHNGTIIQNFKGLQQIEPALKFAMNGGMYTPEYAPVGLYVENGKQIKGIKKYNNPKVNFGLQPQGIFLVRKGSADVVSIEDYKSKGVLYATQSAPMLVLNSRINPQLPHSDSRNIRNGVGVLPNGKVLLVISNNMVKFQEFAQYFVDKGCTSALYLDGAISEAYVPGDTSYGSFGVMIGVVK